MVALTGTITLADAALTEKDPMRKGVMYGLIRNSMVADLLTWRTIPGLQESGIRYDNVPSPDWVPLDGAITVRRVTGKPLKYGIFQMLQHIDVPAVLENQDADLIIRQSKVQSNLALKGAAYVLNDTFVNGDQGSDPNQFQGINKLVADMPAAQTVGASLIDLTAAYSDSLAESFFIRLDAAFDECEDGIPDFGLLNKQYGQKMLSLARQYKMKGNDFDWTDYEAPSGTLTTHGAPDRSRPKFKYRGVPFYDIGFKADQTTQIMTNVYTEGGSTANGSRIFLCKKGDMDLEGIQGQPLDIIDIGMLPDKHNKRWRLVWTPGLAVWGLKSIVKVQGVRVL